MSTPTFSKIQMGIKMSFSSVLVTFPDKNCAKSIAEKVIENKLAACVNMFPIDSIYRWDSNIQHECEIGGIFKIRSEDFKEFSEYVQSLHPYEVPCIVSCEISNGTDDYLNWIKESTTRD